MTITVSDLDKDVKDVIRGHIMEKLFKQYSTLPNEIGKIDSVIQQPGVTNSLDSRVKDYYRSIAERDVDVSISAIDYRQVWLHLV